MEQAPFRTRPCPSMTAVWGLKRLYGGTSQPLVDDRHRDGGNAVASTWGLEESCVSCMSAHDRTLLARIRPGLGRTRPSLPGVGPTRLHLTDAGRSVVELVQFDTKLGRGRAKFRRSRTALARFRPILGRVRASSCEVGKVWPGCDQFWGELGQARPNIARIRSNVAELGPPG